MWWRFWLYAMVVLYIGAGMNHFISTGMYVSIMPPWLPQPLLLVYISGICEMLFGVLLLPVATRRWAAWGIIFLLIAVFPANVQMAMNYSKIWNAAFWLSIARLPLQIVLIRWAWLYARRRKHSVTMV